MKKLLTTTLGRLAMGLTLAIALSFLLLAGFSSGLLPPQAEAQGVQQASISNPVTAMDVNNDTGEPIGVTDAFLPDAPFIYLVADATGPAETVFEARWALLRGEGEEDEIIATVSLTLEADLGADGWIWFRIGRGEELWQAGLYEVIVSINAASAVTVPFRVVAPPGGQPPTPEPPPGVLVPSEWQGELFGDVAGMPFSLPVIITLDEPADPNSASPMELTLTTQTPYGATIGHLLFTSSLPAQQGAPDQPTLFQYAVVTAQETGITAELVETHREAGKAVNTFIGPNLTCESAEPGLVRQHFCALGPHELFAFDLGTSLAMQFDGGQLQGTLSGAGASTTGVVPLSDVTYIAQFIATRIR